MFLEGPLIFISVPLLPKSGPVYWIASGIAIGGIGGALIMPSAMPALVEVSEGYYPPSKDAESKNAMGALISLAFGTGNFFGTMCGGYFEQWFSTKKCLTFPKASVIDRLKKIGGLENTFALSSGCVKSASNLCKEVSQSAIFNHYNPMNSKGVPIPNAA